jgi:iron complex outermembrane receptor protein
MGEQINKRHNTESLQRRLLTSVSMLALLALVTPLRAEADETDRPTVWIELGGQFERMDGTGEPYAPAFVAAYRDSDVFHPISPSQADKAPLFAIGAESSISFEPTDTNWVLSASILYGRSNGNKHVHHQVTPSAKALDHYYIYGHNIDIDARFADTRTPQSEGHTVVDFQAGKDFGLGMFGRDATSVFSFGVRFAQFASRARVNIEARPDLYDSPTKANRLYFHVYTASAHSDRSFRGVGPSLSWKASAPVVGNRDDGEIDLDWGLDAAVLFGRQKSLTTHGTLARFHNGKYYHPYTALVYYHPPNPVARARFVTVPNAGGFAALSIKYPAARISFGYRGEMFFGAVDGGWDSAHKQNLSFHGPYATISVGLGG